VAAPETQVASVTQAAEAQLTAHVTVTATAVTGTAVTVFEAKVTAMVVSVATVATALAASQEAVAGAQGQAPKAGAAKTQILLAQANGGGRSLHQQQHLLTRLTRRS
jgi:hypothetical protein